MTAVRRSSSNAPRRGTKQRQAKRQFKTSATRSGGHPTVNFDRSVVIYPPGPSLRVSCRHRASEAPCGLRFGPRKAESSFSAEITVIREACVRLLAVRAPGVPR
jgi:hypothetical protein